MIEKSYEFKMETRYIALHEDTRVKIAIRHIRKKASVDMIFYAYVVDNKGRLKGVLHLRNLLLAPEYKKIKYIMDKRLVVIREDMKDEEIVEIFKKTKFLALPVVDKLNRLKGMVTLKNAIDIIQKENAEDLLKSQGADIRVFNKSIFKRLKIKLPWLITTVISGLICGVIVFLFEPTLKEILALAFFIPLITAMGESVAGQASAIIIEGIAIGAIKEKKVFNVIIKQITEGFIMAILIGMIILILSLVWLRDLFVANIITTTIIITVIIATINGTLGPLVLKRLKIDPVASTNPLVFAITDITVLIFYFSFAILMLKNIKG